MENQNAPEKKQEKTSSPEGDEMSSASLPAPEAKSPEEAKPNNEMKPTKEAKPNNESKPAEEVKPTNESKPAEEAKTTANENAGKQENSAQHFFLYLFSFFSLLVFSTGVGAIIFQLINKNFTDNLRYDYSGYFTSYAVKYGIASILITAPLYFLSMYLINKYLFKGEISENSKIRKWLTYIILFLASATIVGDLVCLVFRMLDGDILIRFILKTLTVLIIAGAIFGYYMWDMRKKNMKGAGYPANKMFLITGASIALVVFVSAFFVVDSPTTARDKKFDVQTIGDVTSVDRAVQNFYRDGGKLPTDLSEIDTSTSSLYYSSDSERAEVKYEKTSEKEYSLCATFRRSNMNDDNERYGSSANEWKHEKGEHCFSRDVKNITVRTNNTTMTTQFLRQILRTS